MMARADAFGAYDAELLTASTASPWTRLLKRESRFEPDYALLTRLLSKPVAAGEVSESGRFAKAIDAWLASELRRAGFGSDEVRLSDSSSSSGRLSWSGSPTPSSAPST